MHDAHAFLTSLTVVLAVAALTTVLFQRLRLPVVLGYILAGLIVGPHVPIPLIADRAIVHTLSELGVILLMFSLGLEFSFPRLVNVAPTAGVTAVVQSAFMGWLGYVAGQAFGWTVMESVFAGGVIAISSTTIIAKVFDEQRIGGRLRELVVAVLLIEDLIAIVLMAMLTAVSAGAGAGAETLLPTVGRLALFLAALVAVGLLVVPRFMRMVLQLDRPETTLVASVGICFATAWVAQTAGYSVALGAFLAGSLVSESGRGRDVEHLVQPVRDMFLAIFFVSVGLMIDPDLVVRHWPAVLAFTLLVVVGKVVGVSVGAFLTGAGVRTSVQAGMSLAQIGEFSYIIAALGLTLGATRDFLYPVAVAVSAITTLTTPWLIRSSGPFAEWVDGKLPHPLQTFATLYGAWVERLRAGPGAAPSRARAMGRLVALDSAALALLIIITALLHERAGEALAHGLPLGPRGGAATVLGIATVLALPLVIGIGRLAHRLGATLAESALPPAAGVDLDYAPRRSLVLGLQLGVVGASGVAVLAVTQPFLPGFAGILVLALVVAVYGIAFWRSTANLDGHVHAVSQAVVQALVRYARAGRPSGQVIGGGLERLPGLGAPVGCTILAGSQGAGRTLAELNLRGRTGATVLAIARGDTAIVTPGATERLHPGDVVGLAGSHDAVAAATMLLTGAPSPGHDPTGSVP